MPDDPEIALRKWCIEMGAKISEIRGSDSAYEEARKIYKFVTGKEPKE